MTKSRTKASIAVVIVIMIAALALIASACSGNEGATTTTVSASSSTTSAASASGSTTSSTIRVTNTTIVVGGKTAEEYAAEIPDLQAAADANPTDLTALQELAVAQYNSGDREDAAATYQKMLGIQDDPMTRNNYANVLRDWGKSEEAKAQYEKAIAADPTLTVAYINLAAMYVKEKNIVEANLLLDRGIAAITGDDQTRLKNYKEQLNSTTTTT